MTKEQIALERIQQKYLNLRQNHELTVDESVEPWKTLREIYEIACNQPTGES